MRLHVGMIGPEKLLGTVDRQLLDHVHVFASAIVTAAGVALGVFVGQDRTGGLAHGGRSEILRGDHLQLVDLPVIFGLHRLGQHGVLRKNLLQHDGSSLMWSNRVTRALGPI